MTLAHERTSQFFEKTRRERRNIVSPEGVPLPVALADHSERFTAFALDWVISILLLLAIYLPLLLVAGFGRFTLIAISIALFIGFVVRNIYFVYFEIAWRGATPGKRIVGSTRRRPRRRAAAAVRRDRAQSHARSGNVPAAGRPHVGRQIRRRRSELMQLSIGVWLVFFAALPLINRDRIAAAT